jgi:hypothetical protein
MSVITINKDMYSPRVSPHPTTAQKSSTFGSLVGRHIGDTYVLICNGLSNFELEVSIVDLTVANAVLLVTRSGASKTDICDRQIHN